MDKYLIADTSENCQIFSTLKDAQQEANKWVEEGNDDGYIEDVVGVYKLIIEYKVKIHRQTQIKNIK